jgi:hypothetical protein
MAVLKLCVTNLVLNYNKFRIVISDKMKLQVIERKKLEIFLTIEDLEEDFFVHGNGHVRLVLGIALSDGTLAVLEVDVILAFL